MTMRALTVLQPWASLIAMGVKPHEFRTRPAPRGLIGQRIAIHAGKRMALPGDLLLLSEAILFEGARAHGVLEEHPSIGEAAKLVAAIRAAVAGAGPFPAVTMSAVLCTVVLGPSIRVADLHRCNPPVALNFKAEAWAWPLTELQIVDPPAPARGAQGFWTWNEARHA